MRLKKAVILCIALILTLCFTFSAFGEEQQTEYGQYPLELPSLKDAYAGHFLFGTAVGSMELKSPKRMAFYANQFNIMTAGNEMKPDALFDKFNTLKAYKETGDETVIKIRLVSAKPLLDFCWQNGIPVHGHTLLWHNQTPEELFHMGYDVSQPLASREIMLARMENYIREVMEMTERLYPGLIISWDVVNEAIDDSTGKLRTNVNWYKTVGPDYVSKAFEFARKYAREGVLLCYNDYNTTNSPKQSGIMNLLAELAAEGNIDCYGFQSHYSMNTASAKAVEKAFDKVIAMGLKIRVSELDITINGKTDANLRMQANRYRDLMELYIRYDEHIVAVHTWGGTDDTSWRTAQYPLLFGAFGQPKPAYWAVLEQAQAEETTAE